MNDRIAFRITKMSCEGCIDNITKKLNEKGLKDFAFDLSQKSLEFKNNHLSEEEIKRLLVEINYPGELLI